MIELKQQQQSIVRTKRQNALSDLEDVIENINSNYESLNNNLEKLNASEQHILKRLEWACGSNPNLNDTILNFETLRKNRNSIFEVKLITQVFN